MTSKNVFADADAADLLASEGKKRETEANQKAYDKMSPEEVFAEFDVDGSGGIDWNEFKAMLPQLGVQMNEAKALKYFNMADTDGGGDIDMDEFRSALFAVNPNTGNTTGFQPSILLTPQDAFELFDVDRSGNIDEDEFGFVMEYMNVHLDGVKQEMLFAKYDKDKSGAITYDEFRQIWLKVCNIKKELDDREIKYPKFSSRAQMEKIMQGVLEEEEEKERHALAEADQYKRWQRVLQEKRFLSNKARRRALLELRNALDLGGQVYTFGTGAYGQFDGEVSDDIGTKASPFIGFEDIAKLWHGRVTPSESFLATIGADDPGAKKLADLKVGVDLDVDDPRTEILYSPFNHSVCASNTAALWGRRITQVGLAANVAVAMSELGEVFTWGGTDQWWHEVEDDSLYGGSYRGLTTPRSQLLLQTGDILPPEDEIVEEEQDPEEEEAMIFKEVLTYFNKWKAPPTGAPRLAFIKDNLVPTLDYEEISTSFRVRGKDPEKKNKVELMKSLYIDIELEKRVLGLRAHRRIRETEEEIAHLVRRKKHKTARELTQGIILQWQPVLEMQAEAAVESGLELRKEEERKLIKKEKNYAKLRAHKHEARLDGKARYTPRGGSLELSVSGITARGQGSHTARGYAAVVGIGCGSNHIAAIHQSGELYTWGFGSAGRLGLDIGGQSSDPRADAKHPTVVQGLLGLPVVQVSCGYSHSAAVTADARLFVWGSASTGKLGLGVISDKEECYCSMPTTITVGDSVRVREVSCGSSHSACVTDKGELYVWGCADGGRLGLGVQRQSTQFRPVKVIKNGNQGFPPAHKGSDHREGTPAFGGQKVLHVSCGNAHTLSGGDVYMAGAQSVLGIHCSIFVKCETLAENCIDKISAGFSHCAASAASGELFCWGSNFTGCCGAPFPTVQFCYEPYNVPCIFAMPINLAIGKPAAQSTVYNGQDAYLGVDGNVDGSDPNYCLSTQSEPQPWWECDLGDYACVQTVKIWNRTDEPHDPSFDRETFRKRLFPCYIMLSQEPFPRDRSRKALGDGNTLLNASLGISCARMKLTKNQRCTTWHVPNNIAARYCRIMLEGLDFLHFAQIEVLGTPGINKPVGKCGAVTCGRNVTSVVIKASNEPADYDMAYKKAVWADARNADLLRQFESYALEFDKYGRGERIQRCDICFGGQLCEICALTERFRDELESMTVLGSVGTERRSLDDLIEVLMNAVKPELNFVPKVKEKRGFMDMFRKKKKKKEADLKKKEDAKNKAKSPEDGEEDEDEEEEEEEVSTKSKNKKKKSSKKGKKVAPS